MKRLNRKQLLRQFPNASIDTLKVNNLLVDPIQQVAKPKSRRRSSADPRRSVDGNLSEFGIQEKVIQWRDSNLHLHPALWTLHAIPNGGYRTKKAAGLAKAEGVVSGVADLFLPVPVVELPERFYAGLYIEMKRPKGKQSAAQKRWQAHCDAWDYLYIVCYSADEAIATVSEYLQLGVVADDT